MAFESSTELASLSLVEQTQPAADAPQKSSAIITTLAQKCMIECRHNIDEATKLFIRRIQTSEPAIYLETSRDAYRFWVAEKCRQVPRQYRASMAGKSHGLNAETMKSMAICWLNCSINGFVLRDATRTDLRTASDRYAKDSRSMAATSKWLDKLSGYLKDDTTKLGEVLKEDTLQRLAQECGVVKISGDA